MSRRQQYAQHRGSRHTLRGDNDRSLEEVLVIDRQPQLPSGTDFSLEMASLPRGVLDEDINKASADDEKDNPKEAENMMDSNNGVLNSPQTPRIMNSDFGGLFRRQSIDSPTDYNRRQSVLDPVGIISPQNLIFSEGRRREVLVPTGLTMYEPIVEGGSSGTMNDNNNAVDANQDEKELSRAGETKQPALDAVEVTDKTPEGIKLLVQEPSQTSLTPQQPATAAAEADINQQLLSDRTLPEPSSKSVISLNESVHVKASYSHNLMTKSAAEKNETINSAKLQEILDSFDDKQSSAAISLIMGNGSLGRKIAAIKNTRFTFYSVDMAVIDGCSLEDLNAKVSLVELLSQQNFWLDVYLPAESDVRQLAELFNIHPLTVEDILTSNTREKCEMSRSYYYLCYRSFDQDSNSPTFMQAFNVYILVYPTFILTFHYFPLASVSNVTKRLEQLKSYLVITPHWINYAILDDITDNFLPVVNALQMEIEAIDDLVLVISVSEQADMLRRITNARKRVTNLQRLLQTKSDVIRVNIKRLESLINPQNANIAQNAAMKDTCLYLGDIQDHVLTMDQLLTNIDTTLGRSHSNYLAQISIDITLASNRANDTMKMLTAIASLSVPLNLLTGFFGMNINIPGTTNDENFGFFIAICVVIGFFTLIAFGLLSKMWWRSTTESKQHQE